MFALLHYRLQLANGQNITRGVLRQPVALGLLVVHHRVFAEGVAGWVALKGEWMAAQLFTEVVANLLQQMEALVDDVETEACENSD